jgi:hypothetical protein
MIVPQIAIVFVYELVILFGFQLGQFTHNPNQKRKKEKMIFYFCY